MSQLWIAIHPGQESTRVICMNQERTLLKARLSSVPHHPRAVQWLLEAIALWEGRKVCGALYAAGGPGGPANSFYREWFVDFEEPLYSIERIESVRRRRRQDKLSKMGDFRDLKQLHLWHQTEGICLR